MQQKNTCGARLDPDYLARSERLNEFSSVIECQRSIRAMRLLDFVFGTDGIADTDELLEEFGKEVLGHNCHYEFLPVSL